MLPWQQNPERAVGAGSPQGQGPGLTSQCTHSCRERLRALCGICVCTVCACVPVCVCVSECMPVYMSCVAVWLSVRVLGGRVGCGGQVGRQKGAAVLAVAANVSPRLPGDLHRRGKLLGLTKSPSSSLPTLLLRPHFCPLETPQATPKRSNLREGFSHLCRGCLPQAVPKDGKISERQGSWGCRCSSRPGQQRTGL